MTPIADMIESMFAQGATRELVVLAVRAVETVRASADVRGHSADERRTRDAERKREKRKLLKFQRELNAAKANDVAASVRKTSADASADTENAPLLTLNKEELFDEAVKSSKEEEQTSKLRNGHTKGSRMVAGAILTDELRQAAIVLGAAPDAVDAMWAEFTDYWVGVPGQRGVKLDWLATWRNDVRRKLERKGFNGRQPQQRKSLADRAHELAERARSAERARGIG